MFRSSPTLPSLVLTTLALAACSDDPVAHSEPVGLKLKATSGDVATGTLTVDKNINTESGNPYAAFVANAEAAIGRAPTRLDVTAVTLTVAPTSTGATHVGELFAGATSVTLVVSGTDRRVPAASHVTVATDGAGPIEFTTAFDDAAVGADLPALLGGQFKVELAGPAATTFASAGASVDLDLRLTFAAYE